MPLALFSQCLGNLPDFTSSIPPNRPAMSNACAPQTDVGPSIPVVFSCHFTRLVNFPSKMRTPVLGIERARINHTRPWAVSCTAAHRLIFGRDSLSSSRRRRSCFCFSSKGGIEIPFLCCRPDRNLPRPARNSTTLSTSRSAGRALGRIVVNQHFLQYHRPYLLLSFTDLSDLIVLRYVEMGLNMLMVSHFSKNAQQSFHLIRLRGSADMARPSHELAILPMVCNLMLVERRPLTWR
jgi:hypothetical protein